MLHDPSHYEPPAPAEPILLSDSEKTALRKLAEQVAAISAEPVQREKAELWRRLNDRRSVRPMVWINEIPWHEMEVDGETGDPHPPPLGPKPGARAAADCSTSGGTCRAT